MARRSTPSCTGTTVGPEDTGRVATDIAGDYVEADGDGDADGDGESVGDADVEPDGVGEDGEVGEVGESVGDADAEADGDGDGDGDADGDAEADGDGDGDTDGDAEADADTVGDGDTDTEAGGDAEADDDSKNGDGDGRAGVDRDGDGWLGVTVHKKLTEPAAPDGDVAVTVTSYVAAAVGEMVPVISPLLLIDKPGGRFDAANCGDCPSAALSDVTCNWIAVPTAFRWLPGSSRRTAAWRK